MEIQTGVYWQIPTILTEIHKYRVLKILAYFGRNIFKFNFHARERQRICPFTNGP